MAGWILELELVYFNNTMAWRCIDMLVIDRFWAGPAKAGSLGPALTLYKEDTDTMSWSMTMS